VNATIEWHGELAMSRFKDGAGVGLRRAAEMLLEASNAAAPTESGHLVESSGVDVDQEGLEASIYYGPTSAPRRGKPVYAIVRHEALRQGGAPKYLERPVIRNRGAAAAIVAAEIRKAL